MGLYLHLHSKSATFCLTEAKTEWLCTFSISLLCWSQVLIFWYDKRILIDKLMLNVFISSVSSLFIPVTVAASRDELHIRKMKLNYEEVGQCSKDAQALWERKLTAPGRTTVPQDKEEMYRALCQGERVCVHVFVCKKVRERCRGRHARSSVYL